MPLGLVQMKLFSTLVKFSLIFFLSIYSILLFAFSLFDFLIFFKSNATILLVSGLKLFLFYNSQFLLFSFLFEASVSIIESIFKNIFIKFTLIIFSIYLLINITQSFFNHVYPYLLSLKQFGIS